MLRKMQSIFLLHKCCENFGLWCYTISFIKEIAILILMVVFQGKGKRNARGSRYKKSRGYKLHELGRVPSATGLGKKRLQKIITIASGRKLRLLSEEVVNVVDPKTKKAQKTKIKTTVENPADRHFVRRNIMTKGAVIDTEVGKAKITSRPGQDGVINAVLIG